MTMEYAILRGVTKDKLRVPSNGEVKKTPLQGAQYARDMEKEPVSNAQ